MSRIRRQASRILVPFFFGVLLMADAGRESAVTPPAADQSAPPAALPTVLLPAYRAAAEHLRSRDCEAALGALSPLGRDDSPEASFARVIEGLYAQACGATAVAEDRLFLGGGPGSPLQDWRLLGLADAAAAAGHAPVAAAALENLLDLVPPSPLQPLAVRKAAEQAWERGDADAALRWVRWARAELDPDRSGEILESLDVLAWEIGAATGRTDVQWRAGRRLLTTAPERAEELAIADLLGSPSGEIRWAAVLTSGELETRARSLAELKRFDEAVATLETVSPPARDLAWHLCAAEVLTGDHRGGEALALLALPEPADPELAARLEWQRALAAADQARAHRGRRNLPASERRKIRERSWQHLRRVVELDPRGELALEALRRLFRDLASDDRFEDALKILRAIRRLDPDDQSGADYLWRQGWESYRRRNYSSAVGYWAELSSLYGEARVARSGRYWTGRAFEALGNRPRAREIYHELAAADTTDFYRKYALGRLDRLPPAEPSPRREPGRNLEPWPRDDRLARASLLTDLGLDDLALTELEAVAGAFPVDGRALAALEARILARKGDLRSSIGSIRRAFPALGGPHQAAVPPEALRLYYPLAFEGTVRAQAERNGVPLHVLFGMIRQESGFDPLARSSAGARGLLQLMPATGREVARRLGVPYSSHRLTDPSFNLQLGAAYFRQVLSMFDDNLELALAGYNGGPYRIRRLWQRAGKGELDTFLEGLRVEESRAYVKRILVLSDSYREFYDLTSGDFVAGAGVAGSG